MKHRTLLGLALATLTVWGGGSANAVLGIGSAQAQVTGCPIGSTAIIGCYRVDGTTISVNGSGVISAIGSGVASIIVGTTTVGGGTTGRVLYDNGALLGELIIGSGLSLNGSTLVTSATPLTVGTSITLAAPRRYFICTGSCTVTPPVPAAGDEFCVYNDVAVSTVITLAALGSSAMYGKTDFSGYGTAGTGTFVSGGAVGDKICIIGRDATHYIAGAFVGAWTAN